MADFSQLPGELNITMSQSDSLSISLEFSLNLTGYTFEANIVKSGAVSNVVLDVIEVDLNNGLVKLQLPDGVTLDGDVGIGEHSWWMKWTDGSSITRKILAGKFILVA